MVPIDIVEEISSFFILKNMVRVTSFFMSILILLSDLLESYSQSIIQLYY